MRPTRSRNEEWMMVVARDSTIARRHCCRCKASKVLTIYRSAIKRQKTGTKRTNEKREGVTLRMREATLMLLDFSRLLWNWYRDRGNDDWSTAIKDVIKPSRWHCKSVSNNQIRCCQRPSFCVQRLTGLLKQLTFERQRGVERLNSNKNWIEFELGWAGGTLLKYKYIKQFVPRPLFFPFFKVKAITNRRCSNILYWLMNTKLY